MGEVVRIAPAVTHRCCPACGYVISQLQADLARINFRCPRCDQKAISDFQPMRWELSTPDSASLRQTHIDPAG